MKTGKSQTVAAAGMLLAAGIILPFVTAHGIGIPGTVLLPMHIPVLLCGFICGPLYGALLGCMLPFVNSVLTSMPVLYPMAPIMAAELTAYGLVSGLLYHKTRLGRKRFGIYAALLAAMLAGRVMYGLAFWVLFSLNGEMKAPTLWTAVTVGIPGIIVQLLLVPPIVAAVCGYPKRRDKGAVLSAVNLIKEGRAACLVIRDGVIVGSREGRGVAPIISLYESGVLKDACVVDKVVGKAAAMVMTLGGVKSCHAVTISRPALAWFRAKKTAVAYDACVDYIVNRTGDGMCPMEQTVRELDDDGEVIRILRDKIRELQQDRQPERAADKGTDG